MRVCPLSSKRWFSYLPVVTVFAAFSACSPKLAPEGHYQDSQVTADGIPSEWKMPLRFTNTAYTMQYNVTNDDQNIYVAVSSLDDITQLRILRSGMTIYFDPKGKKNRDVSIHFPIPKAPDPNGNRSRGDGSTTYYQHQNNTQNRDTRKEELLLQSDFYNTTGFTGIENGQFSVSDPKAPIHVGIKLNNQDSLLVYEVIIPIKNILGPDWTAKSGQKEFQCWRCPGCRSGIRRWWRRKTRRFRRRAWHGYAWDGRRRDGRRQSPLRRRTTGAKRRRQLVPVPAGHKIKKRAPADEEPPFCSATL